MNFASAIATDRQLRSKSYVNWFIVELRDHAEEYVYCPQTFIPPIEADSGNDLRRYEHDA